VIAVIGPTASGKSEFAVKLAKRIGGEIISADSRQVYKYLDIGSAKVPGKWLAPRVARYVSKLFIYKGIPHHCIDFVNPKKRFTVAEWKKCAEKAIQDIRSRGKIPIICGGTYFYIDSILDGSKFPEVPPDEKLRKRFGKLSADHLFKMLRKLDPRRAENIDPQNKRRLIRALEIVIKTGKPVPAKSNTQHGLRVKNTKIIALNPSSATLKKRIAKRLKERLKNGLVEEVKNLHEKHRLTWKRLDELGLEYRYVSRYIRGLITRDAMVSKINSETWRYAKKQILWLTKS